MPSPKHSGMLRFLPLLGPLAAILVGPPIRSAFGVEAYKELVPFIIAGPVVYGVIRWSRSLWPVFPGQASRLVLTLAMPLWIVGMACCGLQSWTDPLDWLGLTSAAGLPLVVVICLQIRRLASSRQD